MVTVSDGVMALRLCASKVHHIRETGPSTDAPCAISVLTKRTFIYATAMSPLGKSGRNAVQQMSASLRSLFWLLVSNSRGYFQPRVPGAQWSHGAMGDAVVI
jgi:hypothetical protein